jgi:hypothetical protein
MRKEPWARSPRLRSGQVRDTAPTLNIERATPHYVYGLVTGCEVLTGSMSGASGMTIQATM